MQLALPPSILIVLTSGSLNLLQPSGPVQGLPYLLSFHQYSTINSTTQHKHHIIPQVSFNNTRNKTNTVTGFVNYIMLQFISMQLVIWRSKLVYFKPHFWPYVELLPGEQKMVQKVESWYVWGLPIGILV